MKRGLFLSFLLLFGCLSLGGENGAQYTTTMNTTASSLPGNLSQSNGSFTSNAGVSSNTSASLNNLSSEISKYISSYLAGKPVKCHFVEKDNPDNVIDVTFYKDMRIIEMFDENGNYADFFPYYINLTSKIAYAKTPETLKLILAKANLSNCEYIAAQFNASSFKKVTGRDGGGILNISALDEENFEITCTVLEDISMPSFENTCYNVTLA